MSDTLFESGEALDSSSCGEISIKDEDFEGLFDFNDVQEEEVDEYHSEEEFDAKNCVVHEEGSNRLSNGGIEQDEGGLSGTSGLREGEAGMSGVAKVGDGGRRHGKCNGALGCREEGAGGREEVGGVGGKNGGGCGVGEGKGKGKGKGDMEGTCLGVTDIAVGSRILEIEKCKAGNGHNGLGLKLGGDETKASPTIDVSEESGMEPQGGHAKGIESEKIVDRFKGKSAESGTGGDLKTDLSSCQRKRSAECGVEELNPGVKRSKSMVSKDKNEVEGSSLCPPHPGFMYGLCVRCGVEKTEDDKVDSLKMSYVHHGLELSKEEVGRIAKEQASTLANEQKLNLVLDLDLTLLNTCPMNELSPEHQGVCENWVRLEAETGKKPTLYCLPHAGIWTKLRPFVFDFLEALQDKFHLHIYTMGDRAYAIDMAKILDPSGKLFGNRVISRNDSASEGVKNLDVVLGSSDSTLIVDDTEAVWPEHRANLLKIERYLFFPFTAQQYNRPSRLLESRRDECPEGGQLDIILKILLLIHSHAFGNTQGKQGGTDVRKMLQSIRVRILRGCTLFFAGLPSQDSVDQHKNRAQCLAEDLGATVVRDFSPKVTHVVAMRGYMKDFDSLAMRCCVVAPSWLEHCGVAWKRVEAHLHSVNL